MTALDMILFAQGQFGKGGPNFGGGGPPPGWPTTGPSGAQVTTGVGTGIAVMLAIYFVVFLVIAVPTFAGMWKAFVKAGQPGWAAIVPIYNFYVMGEISGKGGMFGLLVAIGSCIPCVGLVAVIFYLLMLIELAKAYGQSTGMAIGLWLLAPVFWPILGFGSAEYVGVGGGSKRRRREFDDDEDEDDRPRRKAKRDDDDDRPRRRRDDDDDDDDRPRRSNKIKRDDY
jgi:hypothetical protein